MSQAPATTVTAIIPCNDLDAAEAWWGRLGFSRPPDQDYGDYRMLTNGEGGEIHLTRAVEGWVIPGQNPFGVYIYTPRVGALAEMMRSEILGTGRAPDHKPWGMYELALNGPDDLLVRIGWPSRSVTG